MCDCSLWFSLPSLGALVLIIYHDVDQKHRVAAESKVEAMRLVGLASTGQKELIDEARQLLETLSKVVDVNPDHRIDCNALLASELKRHPHYVNFGVAALDGSVFCSALPLTPQDGNINITDRHYFQRALKTRDFAVGSYQMGRIAKTFTINFGYPILSGTGEPQAVLFTALDLSYLVRAAGQAELPEGAVLTIRDPIRYDPVQIPRTGKVVRTLLTGGPHSQIHSGTPGMGHG